jgi:hypothetical protein
MEILFDNVKQCIYPKFNSNKSPNQRNENSINKMPEVSCRCEAAGGSLWTGEVFGLFVLQRG